MHTKLNQKLLITGICLLLSVVLLVGASFAWFTVSTSPEISGMQVRLFTDQALLVSADGKEYSQYIDLSEQFKYYAPLKPISTINGRDWFIASYKDDGSLDELSAFRRDSNLENANVMVYSKTGEGENAVYTPLTGDEYTKANEKGYYVWCEFWLKTELDEGCQVTLSAPDRDKGNIEDWEKEQNVYGSYVLANYGVNEETQEAYMDTNAQNAMRVGFLTGEANAERFVIYEPNADKRSSISQKPDSKEGSYIIDFALEENTDYTETGDEPKYLNYQDNQYIPTKPIGSSNGTISAMQIQSENLIIQKAGSWNDEELQNAINEGESPNSGDVAEFGRFVRYSNTLNNGSVTTFPENDTGTDLASTTMVVDLEKDTPQKVTMFIWIEGQDADCWNDIASGSFVVNLEFAAQEKIKENNN